MPCLEELKVQRGDETPSEHLHTRKATESEPCQTRCCCQATCDLCRKDWRLEAWGREPVSSRLQNLKTTEMSTVGEWLKTCYLHSTEYYVGVKKSEIDFEKMSKIYCSVKRTSCRTACVLRSHPEAKTGHSPADTRSAVWRKQLEGCWKNYSQMLSLRDGREGEVLLFHCAPSALLNFDHELIVLSQEYLFLCFAIA